jgi:lipoic acid synthetase
MAERLPPWIRMQIPSGKEFQRVKSALSNHRLHTVCQEARCPNRGDCWGRGTAAFMVLGAVCSRSCLFCGVDHAPTGAALPGPDPGEPRRVLEALKVLDLRYAVLTAVTRDDLEDGGAGHIAAVVAAVGSGLPSVRVEALIPDILPPHLGAIVGSGIHILAHNIEVPRRLTPLVRDARAGYEKSLEVLREAKRLDPGLLTKSSLILGLGESEEEVLEAMEDLRRCRVDLLTLGQYLRPAARCLPVDRYLEPGEWEKLGAAGEKMGFKKVFSGPLVRSSYLAGEMT